MGRDPPLPKSRQNAATTPSRRGVGRTQQQTVGLPQRRAEHRLTVEHH